MCGGMLQIPTNGYEGVVCGEIRRQKQIILLLWTPDRLKVGDIENQDDCTVGLQIIAVLEKH